MTAKQEVLKLDPKARLHIETQNPNCQSRMIVLDKDEYEIGWNWGHPNQADNEDAIWWKEALETLQEGR